MQKSKERYEDYKSTGYMFMCFGVIGLVYTIIDYLDVWEKTNFINSLFQCIVTSVMFVIFIIIGISSYRTSKSILKTIPLENDLAEKINSYLASNLTKEYVDSLSKDSVEPQNDADTYYQVVSSMSANVKDEYPDASEDLINELVENYYNENF